jgi:uncharacterized protein
MRWQDMRPSENVDDRTDGSGSGSGGGFPIGGIPLSGGAVILIVVVSLLFGVNPLELLGLMDSGTQVQAPQSAPPPGYGPQRAPGPSGTAPAPSGTAPAPSGAAPGSAAPRRVDPQRDFVARVLGDTEDVWGSVFQQMGKRYQPPRLELFRGATQSACGRASAATGPFYCPGDRDVYLDTAFFNELHNRFGAPGDFAQAYVIAHEVGHHVQNLLGTMQQFDSRASRADPRTRNALSIRLELQADCYAGVWGFYAQKRGLIDASDVDSGLRAAAAVGDDNIQKHTQGYVVPESFTHGSAEQRTRWFRTGLESGDPKSCDTFAPRTP